MRNSLFTDLTSIEQEQLAGGNRSLDVVSKQKVLISSKDGDINKEIKQSNSVLIGSNKIESNLEVEVSAPSQGAIISQSNSVTLG